MHGLGLGAAGGAAGVYHAGCEGVASWYDFACETLRLRVKAAGSTTIG